MKTSKFTDRQIVPILKQANLTPLLLLFAVNMVLAVIDI